MNGSKTVTGELVRTFQGGRSEKFNKYCTVQKVGLFVGVGCCLYLYYLCAAYYLSSMEPLVLALAIVVGVAYYLIAVPRQKAIIKEGEKVIEVHDDGVILYTSDGKAEFTCPFETLKEPTVKTLLDCYQLELTNKYNNKASMCVKSLESGWEICETIRNTAIAAGKEQKGE